jgi:hypothetical protein
MMRLGVVYNGAFPEQRLLNRPDYSKYFAGQIYLPQIAEQDLSQYDALIVPEGTHHVRLRDATPQILDFVQHGHTLLAFGDQPNPWLPGMDWEFREARKPDRGEFTNSNPDHGFHTVITYDDMYHNHGVFTGPEGSEPLITTPDGRAVIYIDRVSTGGTLFVTSMDLFVHAAMQANPMSHRFLERFLPWVCEGGLA